MRLSMMPIKTVSEEELAYREALRVANIEFERIRSQAERVEAAESLERMVRERIRRLADRLLTRPPDADAEEG
jgi:hypothetical protein